MIFQACFFSVRVSSTRKGNTYLGVIKSTFSSNSPDGILQEPLQSCYIHFRDFTSTLFFLAKCFKHFFCACRFLSTTLIKNLSKKSSFFLLKELNCPTFSWLTISVAPSLLSHLESHSHLILNLAVRALPS